MFISIIMPVYNNQKFVSQAIDSILAQSFEDWELIIVDDGSTDNTPHIVDAYSARDKRIKVIHQQNQWIYNSLNNGITEATGDYVLLVNSDDMLGKDALQSLYNVANNADIILYNQESYIYNDKTQKIEIYPSNHKRPKLEKDFFCSDIEEFHKMWIDLLIMGLISHQVVYKTSLARENKYRTDVYGADYLYNIYIAKKITSVAGTLYPVYKWIKYNDENMNASVGKYYNYQHEMFNEIFFAYKQLFLDWNVWNEKSMQKIFNDRISCFSAEMRSLLASNCHLSIDEKVNKIFADLEDGVVFDCAKETNRIEEFEARVLSGLRALFVKEEPSVQCEYYFFYELVDSLLRYEKTEEDMQKIKNAVFNKKNKYNIGKTFLDKLVSGE